MDANRMGTESTRKLLIEFSIPAIIGMVVSAIYNIVDRIFIGNTPDIGSLGLAAITVTYPVTLISLALCLLVGVGGATRFSISLGLKNKNDAATYMGNAFLLILFFALLFMIFGNLFIEPILYFLGASEAVEPYAVDYLSIILFGSVFQAISMYGNNFSRAQGNPKNAMISQLLGAGFNILFDYIFIVQFGWGMKGAAYATIGGMFLSAVWQLAFLCSKRSYIPITLKLLKPKVTYMLEIIKTGMPIFLMQLSNSILNIILNGSLAINGGDLAVSTVGIITSFQTLLLMPVSGIIQGQQAIIGYNFGADKMQRVKDTLRDAAIAATIIVVAGFLVVQFMTVPIITMFNKEPDVIRLGVPSIRIWFAALPIVGMQIIFSSYFQAVGKAKIASFLTLSRQILLLIPLILILSRFFGLTGIFLSVPISDVLSFAISSWFLKKEMSTHYHKDQLSID
ncbi:MATE family efflux transporter [Carnobacterium gallinarum]|uniref:MATE family efflux transporter n=1 Tax=Carnobacterium gallinarum TaxID=2749 RepID=UPI000559192B|nr:MATE family efflux transporter [Carnobacterium gallinarum]